MNGGKKLDELVQDGEIISAWPYLRPPDNICDVFRSRGTTLYKLGIREVGIVATRGDGRRFTIREYTDHPEKRLNEIEEHLKSIGRPRIQYRKSILGPAWGDYYTFEPECNAVVVFAAGVEDSKKFSGYDLPPRAKMRTIAAVEVYKKGRTPLLIFTGGGKNEKGITEAEAMSDYARRLGVPREAIRVEEKSHESTASLENVVEMLEAEGVTEGIGLLTDGCHLRRVLRYGRNLGLKELGIEAEGELLDRSYHYTDCIDNIRYSRRDKVIEHLFDLLLHIDRGGRIPRLIAKKTRI